VEVWIYSTPVPDRVGDEAALAERLGFVGLSLVDTQNVFGDVFVALTIAAQGTETLRIGTSVTNPVTRHPAVLAGAFATLQELSGGRVVAGIGRGDSALAHIGHGPAGVAATGRFVVALQAYLAGEAVDFEAVTVPGVGPAGSLGLAGAPARSRLEWLDPDLPKVSVEVAAFVNVVVDEDTERAARVGGTTLSSLARFSIMHGATAGPHDDAARAGLEAIHGAWDMTKHGFSAQAEVTPQSFRQAFGIFGAPTYCVERLLALRELGVERVTVCGPAMESDPEERATAARRLAEEVMPAVTG
jgi:5,10-methylenetetrahydromethanopterin reductase